MAKNDNLKDFLTDVADAIREKKGTTDLINPQDFSAEIASIQSGGGAVSVSAKAVNFRDYDGTILHSYTKDEFLALSELPPLPTREGLICQEWNYDFVDAVEYVTEYGALEVGATYITDDGKTRLYITIEKGRQDISLNFSYNGDFVIDWGDGSTFENRVKNHHYENEGSYIIAIEVVSGTIELGEGSYSKSLMGTLDNSGYVYCNALLKAEIGSGVKRLKTGAFGYCYSLKLLTIPKGVAIGNGAFVSCFSLKSLVIPKGCTTTGNQTFRYCYALESIAIPKSVTSIGSSTTFNECFSLKVITIPQGVSVIDLQVFKDCHALACVVLPNSLTRLGDEAFSNCQSLESIKLPNSVLTLGSGVFVSNKSIRKIEVSQNIGSIGSSPFGYCFSMTSFAIPQGLTSISANMFYYCYSLHSLVFPKGIATINNSAFSYCGGMAFYDFSALEAVPTLGATSAFNKIPSDCKIIVPDALYDEWIAATNWSTYASYIIKKSDWDALNA